MRFFPSRDSCEAGNALRARITAASKASVALGLLLTLGGPGTAAPPRTHQVTPPPKRAILQPAPDFRLQDADGKPQRLAQYRGRPVTLFFFCGCEWCARCAKMWGQFQRSGVLQSAASSPRSVSGASADPATLIVFSGDGAAARAFALAQGMDLAQTVLLPDTTMQVTQTLYNAEPCPRVFVVDPQGLLRYTNDHPDDAARKDSEAIIVSRALDALRSHRPVQPVRTPKQ